MFLLFQILFQRDINGRDTVGEKERGGERERERERKGGGDCTKLT